MPFTRLDDNFHSHPKVVRAGLDGAGLYARSLSYCGDYLTDGFVPSEWVEGVCGSRSRALPQRLVEAGLWELVEGGYQIPDYLEFNDAREDVLRWRAERSAGGRKGARKRWAKSGSTHGSTHGSTYSSTHGSPDGSPDGSSIARGRPRDRAASTPNQTPQGPRDESSSRAERGSPSFVAQDAQGEELQEPAAAEPPSHADVRAAVAGLRDSDAGTFRHIEPLALQLPAPKFWELVEKTMRRRGVANDAGLLVSLLRDEVVARQQASLAAVGGNGISLDEEKQRFPESYVVRVRRSLEESELEEYLEEFVPDHGRRELLRSLWAEGQPLREAV